MRKRNLRAFRPRSQRGIVLVIVLVVVAVLAFSAYAFSDLMFSHREATTLSGQQLQARLLVESGADMIRIFLAQSEADRTAAGGIYDNAMQFRGITVVPDDDPRHRGSFTVVSPSMGTDGNLGGVRFGLEDESTRLNLNSLLFIEKQSKALSPATAAASALGTTGATTGAATGTSSTGASTTGSTSSAADTSSSAGRTVLMALPGMSEEIADAILDWLDDDDDARENGAERDYYSGLNPPYSPKNGPFETVEELLLVRGVSPQMLFGKDANRNGMVDSHEMNLPLPDGVDNSDGRLDRGWSAYLTLFGQEKNVDEEGLPRINLNGDDLTKLYNDLLAVFDQEWATFIVAYRQNGPSTVSVGTAGSTSSSGGGEIDLTQPAKAKFSQVLDLIDAQTQVRYAGSSQSKSLKSPFSSDLAAMNTYLPKLMAKVSTSDSTSIPGRININQASKSVLMGIPGMTEEIVNEIISVRSVDAADQNAGRKYETWLLCEGLVTLAEMKQMLPFVCAGGHVYRAQIVGYFQSGQAASRAEVIFDATQSSPRLLLWRDISHLGRGYALETLGVDFVAE